MPDGIEDIDSFIQRFEEIQTELDDEKEIRNNLIMDRANLSRDMPDESSEELEKQLKEADENLQIVFKKGEAIAHLRDLTDELLEQMDSDTYARFEKGFRAVLICND